MKKDEVFEVSHCSYEDRTVIDTMQAIKDFNFDAEWCGYLDANHGEDGYYIAEGFPKFLEDSGFAKSFPITGCHLGDPLRYSANPESCSDGNRIRYVYNPTEESNK